MPTPIQSLRVFAEEIEPPGTLRLSWRWRSDVPDSPHERPDDTAVAAALRATEGVALVENDDDAVIVTFDSERLSRFDLARIIRTALGAEPEEQPQGEAKLRVWAEDLAKDRLRVTWEVDPELTDLDRRAQCRRVAAWLVVLPAVHVARPDGDGVAVRYDPAALDRAGLGETVRSAVDDEGSLRERAEDLMRRSPTYGNLARKLAMDGRISPLPDAAKQAAMNHGRGRAGGSMASQSALRFVPGGTMIVRVQTMLPVLQELSNWSRESDPAIVDGHLAEVGLTREKLQRDTVTAHEIRYYARDFATETTAQLSERAVVGAKQAVETGRDLFESVRETFEARRDSSPSTDDRSNDSDDDLDSKVL